MKLGFHVNDFGVWNQPEENLASTIVEISEVAEASGFDSIAMADHLWQSTYMGGPEGHSMECYVALTYVAAHTDRVKLIPLASPVNFRHPSLLAKMVSSLDVLSGGRTWLGVGIGHYEEEMIGLGIPYPSVSERFEMLEEELQICLQMWSGEHGDDQPYNGEHYQLGRALNLPQVLSRPHPPIMIAGSGEQKTLRLVARYGDACNIYPFPDAIRHKLEVLRQHCETERRDYDEIEKTSSANFDVGEDGSKVEELIDHLRMLADNGIETVFGRVEGAERITPIEIMGREVIPAVAEF